MQHAGDMSTWSISLYSFGDLPVCISSYTCCPCAMAYARSELDGSSFLFNVCCSSICLNRWIVRSGYEIKGGAITDCVESSFCAPCVANQTLHMVLKENGTSQRKVKAAGMFTEKWKVSLTQYLREASSKVGTFACDSNLFYSTCCRPCAVASLMEKTIGMPFWWFY